VTELTDLDPDRWRAAWAGLPADRREVYFHPDYAHCCAAWERARPACLRARKPGGELIYPYLIHTIADANGAVDLQTAYGYGGPLFTGEWTPDERAGVLRDIADHFRSGPTVAEFVRCHTEWADLDALAATGYRTFQVRTNVECDLTAADFTATWAPGARRNLRKAQSSGLSHRPGTTPEDWAAFAGLYAATASRLNMAASYRFDDAYFAALAQVPNVRLILVESESTPVAAAIVFVGGRLAHYHLGASDFAYADRRPNDYLYYAMAETARAAGCERIVWGGGMSNDAADTLFRFKSHFGAIRRPVYCAGRVIDPTRYQSLCDVWAARNPGRTSPMFLKYRA
jgi:hypothetical protein